MTSCWLRCEVWAELPFMPGAAGTHLLGNNTGVSHLDARAGPWAVPWTVPARHRATVMLGKKLGLDPFSFSGHSTL